MRVCLINPPSPFLLDERVFMPIGILRVAAYLEKEGIGVDFLDLAGVRNYHEVVQDYIKQNPDVLHYGITATTPQYPNAVKISEILSLYDTFVTLGGPHVSLIHSAKKKGSRRAERHFREVEKSFDALVCGDGEKAYRDAVITSLHKTWDADDPKSGLWLTNEDLDRLPLPSRHLIDIDSYEYKIDCYDSISVICQLGCPFNCQFCGGRNSPFLRRVRTRSVNSVVKEIAHLYFKYGKTGFMFYDDELNVSKSFKDLLRELVKLQKNVGRTFRFRGFLKSELFDEEQADLMYKAGFRWILTGFESGDSRILENIQKKATLEDNTKFVEIAHKYDLKVKALMSIGHAGETFRSIQNTKNWLLEIKPDEFDCTIITPYPGSPYYDDAELTDFSYCYKYQSKNGDILYQKDVNYATVADYYKGDPFSNHSANVWTEEVSAKNLVVQRNLLESEVRTKLNLNWPQARQEILYDHSMGQGIPNNILRRTNVD